LGAQCVNGDLALDAFDMDGLRVALHRRQQVRGAGPASGILERIQAVGLS
jgi:hypothetical protein